MVDFLYFFFTYFTLTQNNKIMYKDANYDPLL